jgi:hypothetical protein
MASANVRTLCAWGKAQYMDAIDVENRIAVEIDAPEPEVSFSLEEFDHYCELFDRLLMIEFEDWVRVEPVHHESLMGSAAHHSNIDGYLNEFDRQEIGEMRARFGTSDWPCTDEKFKVGEESPKYKDILADRHPPEESLESLSDADRRDLLLRAQNTGDLRTIQRIFLYEEGRVLSLDETLTRVLSFYRRFLPF